ncbi:MAG: GIY-YIG nuclease family protein [Bacteriovoracaceae bacterium]
MIYIFEAEFNGQYFYKVGFTRSDVKYRLDQIQATCPVPLRVAQVFHGDLDDEKKLHSYLDCLRIHNEWFKSGPLIKDVIHKWKGGQIEYPIKREVLTRNDYLHLFLSRARRPL